MDLEWFQQRVEKLGAALTEQSDPKVMQAKMRDPNPTPTHIEREAQIAIMELGAVLLHDIHRIADGLAERAINGDGLLTQRVQPRDRG